MIDRQHFKNLPRPKTVGLEDQIKAVAYELSLRENAYPRFIAQGKLTLEKAEREYINLRAALDTLLKLKEQGL